MNDNGKERGILDDLTLRDSRPYMEEPLPPWLFRHDDLIRNMTSAGSIEKRKLANILNYIHFKGDHLHALLDHPLYDEKILVKIHPEPCLGDELICRWDRAYDGYKLERYHFQYLILSHEQSIILVQTRIFTANHDGLTIQLPENSLVITKRQAPRFKCSNVKAELWQNGFQAEGSLVDFSPHAFRIRVHSVRTASFHWFNAGAPATLQLTNGNSVFYSGNCNCMYQQLSGPNREIIVAPIQKQIQRFKAKAIRNPRRQSFPSFHAVFEHPFIKRIVQREIFDIATSGFSIYDKSEEAVLIPGMIIPDMTIAYAGAFNIHCKVQVVYRKDEPDMVRFGLVMLDIDMTNYKKLNQILNNINGGTSNDVDIDALWEFFFDADFIYPQKYKILHAIKDDFHVVYRKLYEESAEIACHFTYQKNGRIYGHVSMLRAYDRTWMIHHHAARTFEGKPTGVLVLKQLLLYLNDVHRLPSANMDYAIAYFRPENEFPERIFGEFAREHGNPQHCSLDLFSYINYQMGQSTGKLPVDWSLREGSVSDFWDFERFYQNHSGGLLGSILKRENQQDTPSLEEIYSRSGFIRRWQTFVLTHRDNMKAFIVAEEADARINLSNLLNGFKVFVMDPDLPPDILFTAIAELIKTHSMTFVSVLIYPENFAEKAGICYDKKRYYLWIANMQIASEFLEYLGRKFRIRLT